MFDAGQCHLLSRKYPVLHHRRFAIWKEDQIYTRNSEHMAIIWA
jgi:hypothetical protein